jgi:hypothetical protein
LADDIHALARPHAAKAIAALVEFVRQREDCHLAMSAMIALLDRGYRQPRTYQRMNCALAPGAGAFASLPRWQ